MKPIGERLLNLIQQRYGTYKAASVELNYSTRQLSRWRDDTPDILIRLEAAGVIHIADESCPCQPSARTDQATSDTA